MKTVRQNDGRAAPDLAAAVLPAAGAAAAPRPRRPPAPRHLARQGRVLLHQEARVGQRRGGQR